MIPPLAQCLAVDPGAAGVGEEGDRGGNILRILRLGEPFHRGELRQPLDELRRLAPDEQVGRGRPAAITEKQLVRTSPMFCHSLPALAHHKIEHERPGMGQHFLWHSAQVLDGFSVTLPDDGAAAARAGPAPERRSPGPDAERRAHRRAAHRIVARHRAAYHRAGRHRWSSRRTRCRDGATWPIATSIEHAAHKLSPPSTNSWNGFPG